MISFIIALVVLIGGYFVYGSFVERVFAPDASRPTPAITMADGVDYLPLPTWKIFMIQFLNIAGTGPIFGAIMGMWFGTSAYLWIVFGCIFAGATHDYLSGMLSLRNGGASLPELVGKYLGPITKQVMRAFTVLLLIMVGAVFVYSPAIILKSIWGSETMWIIVIFVYYLIATMMPIDKIIGKIYPLFAFSLLFMALALLVGLFWVFPTLPEVWDGMQNLGVERLGRTTPIIPALFITIACGAISGFHATQSPLMARCMKSEKIGRPIFYGSMITEGIVALIWATVSSYFFYEEGWKTFCTPEVVDSLLNNGKTLTQNFPAPKVVMTVCKGWLGMAGGILALLGVVAAPITSGDTALRSARLIVADLFHMRQHTIKRRLFICMPLFAITIAILIWQIENPDGFNIIWSYFGWANQTLSVFTLWTLTVYLAMERKNFYIMLIPALFMTAVCISYICISSEGFTMPPFVGYTIGASCTCLGLFAFMSWRKKYEKAQG